MTRFHIPDAARLELLGSEHMLVMTDSQDRELDDITLRSGVEQLPFGSFFQNLFLAPGLRLLSQMVYCWLCGMIGAAEEDAMLWRWL